MTDLLALCIIRINRLWIPHDVICIYDTVFVRFGIYHDLFFAFRYFFTTLWRVYHDDFSVLINWKTSFKKKKTWKTLKLHIKKLLKQEPKKTPSISSFVNTKPNTQCTWKLKLFNVEKKQEKNHICSVLLSSTLFFIDA